MHTTVTSGRENKTLDVFKFAVSIIIAATHLPTLFSLETADLYFKGWFIRFCVPFFFISTGYFFYRSRNKFGTIKRVFWLFALGYTLYLPLIVSGTPDLRTAFSHLRWCLVVGYEHLWYLNAVLQGLLIWYVLEKIPVIRDLFQKFGIPVSFLLLMLGALLDEHYHLVDHSLVKAMGNFILAFGGPRNAVFMGFPLLMLGGAVARWEGSLRKIPTAVLCLLWILLRGLAFWECSYLLQMLGNGISTDLTFFGCLPALVLFLFSFRFQIPVPESLAKLLRRMSEYIYVLHPMVAASISAHIYLYPQQPALLILTVILCCVLYVLLEKQFVIRK